MIFLGSLAHGVLSLVHDSERRDVAFIDLIAGAKYPQNQSTSKDGKNPMSRAQARQANRKSKKTRNKRKTKPALSRKKNVRRKRHGVQQLNWPRTLSVVATIIGCLPTIQEQDLSYLLYSLHLPAYAVVMNTSPSKEENCQNRKRSVPTLSVKAGGNLTYSKQSRNKKGDKWHSIGS